MGQITEQDFGDDRAEKLFGKQSDLEKQFSKFMVEKLISDDERISRKWSAFNAVLIELKNLGEFNIVKEIQYTITEPKRAGSYDVFIDAIKKSKSSPELERVNRVMFE